MPTILLPASAAAFAPRGPPTVVLNTKVEPWLTATLKRTNRVKRPLNSAPQHMRCLTDTLAAPSAIWTLCSIMLEKAPEAELRKDSNPLVEALFNYQLIHVEAYVVHVDLVLENEVAFKLTAESIEALVDYHKDIYCLDMAASTHDWAEKEQQVRTMHQDFLQAVNKFVYRAHAQALEGLEEDGAGELLCGRSEDVKNAIMALFLPLLPPPPPRPVEVVRPPVLLPSSPSPNKWWSQSMLMPTQTITTDDPWKMMTSSAESTSSLWASMPLTDAPMQSPTPAYSEPAFCTSADFYAAALTMAPIPHLPLPLPSLLTQQQCSTSTGFGGFGWDRYQEYTSIM